MSTTIDQKVVEMQFDNRHFEKNVSTTMSSLDKLKQKLDFTGASKGLESVGSAAGKVDMSGLSNGVETVRAKFSALEVMGVTALANITNSAVNAGKRILSALTIDPVKTGFNEYELKMDSVRTIMNSTGRSVEDINKLLGELNEYSDQTIYSFKDMTQNIGKFTNAGVKLEDAVMAIKGISNEAAVSGANAAEASRAMYNFAQALSSGYVKLIDWKSIENANMATVEFKQQLIDTAVSIGQVTKSSDGMYKTLSGKTFSATQNFNDVLQEQWMTSDVLVETLKKYADNTTEIGKKAFKAAQEVTKFTQMWDVLKETAQSGWAQTWEILFGDINQAKAIFTPLTNFFSKIIDGISDARNNLLNAVMNSSFGKLIGQLTNVTSAVTNVMTALDDTGEIVNRVIRGEFGVMEERWSKLTELGYNCWRVQDAVNEAMGDSYRHSKELIDAMDKQLGRTGEVAQKTEDQANATVKVTDADKERIKQLVKMNDEQLIAAGYTEQQIAALKELVSTAERLGLPLEEFIDNMDQINGRWLIINSFKNLGQGLVEIFNAVKAAWQGIFPPKSLEERAAGIFNIIIGIHKFTADLRASITESSDEITRTFKGLFALFDIILTVVGGPVKIAFKLLIELLAAFDLNIWDVTAAIGDVIVGFRDWIDRALDFKAVFEKISPVVSVVADAISGFTSAIGKGFNIAWSFVKKIGTKLPEAVRNIIPGILNAVGAFKEWIATLKNSDNLPRDIANGIMHGLGVAWEYIRGLFSKLGNFLVSGFNSIPGDMIAGFANGIWNGMKTVAKVVVELATMIIDKVCAVLGIHSPSVEFFNIGLNIIAGLLNGVQSVLGLVWDFLRGVVNGILGIFGDVDWGTVISVGLSAGLLFAVLKLVKILSAIVSPLEGLSDLLYSANRVVRSFNGTVKAFNGVLRSFATAILAKAVKDIAIALLILVGAITVLTMLPVGKMWGAIGAIAVLLAILTGFMGVLYAIGKTGKDSVAQLVGTLWSLAGVLAVFAIAVAILGNMSWDSIGRAAASIGGLVAVIVALTLISKIANMKQIGTMLSGMASAMLTLAIIFVLFSWMSWEGIAKGVVGLAGLAGIIALLMLISKIANTKKVAVMLKEMAGIMITLALICLLFSWMSWDGLAKAGAAMAGLLAVMTAMMLITKIGNFKQVGMMLKDMAAAMALMALTALIICLIPNDKAIKAAIGLIALSGLMLAMVFALKKIGPGEAMKVGSTLFIMSAAIGILAMVAVLLSLMPLDGLAKGVVAVSILAGMMSLMALAVKGMPDQAKTTGTIIALTAAIAVMAIAVAALGFMDSSKVATGTACMVALMGTFALMTKMSKNATGSWQALLVMVGGIAILAGAVFLLGQLPMGSAIESAVALSVLMLAMTAALRIMGQTVQNAVDIGIGIGALLLMAVPLLAFVGILALMSGVQNATENAMALTVLTTALSVLLALLSGIGVIIASTGGMALLGIAALLLMAVPLIAFVGVLAAMSGVQNAESVAQALCKMLIVFTAVLTVLAIIGPMAMVGVTALGYLIGLVTVMGLLVTAIGALMTYFPQLEEFVDKGIVILEKLAYGIGSFVGNLISGFLGGIAKGLPDIGLLLAEFATNAQPFIAIVKQVDDRVLAGVGILTASVLALTAVSLIEGIAKVLQFGSSFSRLGTELSAFMINAMPFIAGARLLNSTMMAGVKALAETVLILTAANVLEGLTSWLTGGSSLEKFGKQLPQLGTHLANFARNLGTFNTSQVTTVQCAAEAIKALASAASEIPGSGGIWQKIVGEQDLGAFASKFPLLGLGIKNFLTNIGTFTDAQVATVKAAAEAVKALAGAASEIPAKGGLWQGIVGEQDLSGFAENIGQLGQGVNKLLAVLPDITEDDAKKVTFAADAVKALASAADGIPKKDGLWQSLAGAADIEGFASQMGSLGEGVKAFADQIGLVDPTAVDLGAKAVVSLATLLGKITEAYWDTSPWRSFAESLPTMGENFASFYSKFASVTDDQMARADRINTFITNLGLVIMPDLDELNRLATVLYGLTNTFIHAASIPSNCMDNFTAALEELGSTQVKSFTDAFSNETVLTAMRTAGSDAVEAFVEGVKSVSGLIETSFYDSHMVSRSHTPIRSCLADIAKAYEDFKAKGEYLAEGFAAGIRAGIDDATTAATEMGEATLSALAASIRTNSPSKEAYKIGDFFDLGFINAIRDGAEGAYSAAADMGGYATSGLSDAISKVKDIIESDVDAQPTIRPVLDLSDVRSGVGDLGRLLRVNPAIGAMADVGVISASMNRRSQNGGTREVVSAIDRLRKDFSELDRATYNINGVTYDDGSNIADAVKTIVRVARVERRR